MAMCFVPFFNRRLESFGQLELRDTESWVLPFLVTWMRLCALEKSAAAGVI